MKVRPEGAYIIKAAESRPVRDLPPISPGYAPPVPTAADRALARVLLAIRKRTKDQS